MSTPRKKITLVEQRRRWAAKAFLEVEPNSYWLHTIKENSGCVDCGAKLRYFQLQFDHLPAYKKLFNIGNGSNRPLEELQAEVAKCEIVCCNCHALRTWTRRQAKARPRGAPPARASKYL